MTSSASGPVACTACTAPGTVPAYGKSLAALPRLHPLLESLEEQIFGNKAKRYDAAVLL